MNLKTKIWPSKNGLASFQAQLRHLRFWLPSVLAAVAFFLKKEGSRQMMARAPPLPPVELTANVGGQRRRF